MIPRKNKVVQGSFVSSRLMFLGGHWVTVFGWQFVPSQSILYLCALSLHHDTQNILSLSDMAKLPTLTKFKEILQNFHHCLHISILSKWYRPSTRVHWDKPTCQEMHGTENGAGCVMDLQTRGGSSCNLLTNCWTNPGMGPFYALFLQVGGVEIMYIVQVELLMYWQNVCLPNMITPEMPHL